MNLSLAVFTDQVLQTTWLAALPRVRSSRPASHLVPQISWLFMKLTSDFVSSLTQWLDTTHLCTTVRTVVIGLLTFINDEWYPTEWPEKEESTHNTHPCRSSSFRFDVCSNMLMMTVGTIRQHDRFPTNDLDIPGTIFNLRGRTTFWWWWSKGSFWDNGSWWFFGRWY